MAFDQDQFNADMRSRLKELQVQLRILPDDQRMKVHESMYDTPDEKEDAALMAATLREVDRRFIAAGWIWRRWFRRHEYGKWVVHNKLTEEKAAEQIIGILQKYDDPSNQEVVRRLHGHVGGIDDSES